MFGLVSKKRLDAALAEIESLNAKIDLLDADLSEAQDAGNGLVRDIQNKNLQIGDITARAIVEQRKVAILMQHCAIRDPKTGRILSKQKGAALIADLFVEAGKEEAGHGE